MRQINLFCFFVDFVVPALFFYCSLFLKHFLLLEITALSFGVHRREPLPEVTGGNLSRLWFHWNSEPWGYRWVELDGLLHHHLIFYPLTTRVVGAPQMISQPFFSGFLCSPLPSGTCRTPGLSCLSAKAFSKIQVFNLLLLEHLALTCSITFDFSFWWERDDAVLYIEFGMNVLDGI